MRAGVAALLLVGATPASSALTPEQALVDGFYRQLTALHSAGRPRSQAIVSLVDRAFDLARLTRVTLSAPWPALTATQQKRAEDLIGRLVALGIAHGLEADRPRALVLRGQRPVSGGVLVRSWVRASRERTLSVQWLIVRTPRGPRIADLIVEGASMAVTRRAEVTSLWRRANRDPKAFLARIDGRVRQLEARRRGAR